MLLAWPDTSEVSFPLRAVAARMLCTYGAQTQRQVATHLGLSTGAAISIQRRNLPGLVARDQHLKRTVQTIEKKLSAQRVPSQAEPSRRAEKCLSGCVSYRLFCTV